jgi:hypothetical protein
MHTGQGLIKTARAGKRGWGGGGLPLLLQQHPTFVHVCLAAVSQFNLHVGQGHSTTAIAGKGGRGAGEG